MALCEEKPDFGSKKASSRYVIKHSTLQHIQHLTSYSPFVKLSVLNKINNTFESIIKVTFTLFDNKRSFKTYYKPVYKHELVSSHVVPIIPIVPGSTFCVENTSRIYSSTFFLCIKVSSLGKTYLFAITDTFKQ